MPPLLPVGSHPTGEAIVPGSLRVPTITIAARIMLPSLGMMDDVRVTDVNDPTVKFPVLLETIWGLAISSTLRAGPHMYRTSR